MPGNKFMQLTGFLLIVVTGISLNVSAQKISDSSSLNKRGEYSLIIYAGGGVSYYTGRSGELGGFSNDVTRTTFSGTFRLIWQPDHLLSVGFETGWTRFYSYSTQHNNQTANTELDGVPLLAVFSMPVTKRIHVFAGVGGYQITTKLNFMGESTASTISLGWMASANYIYPINRKLGIAGEIKYMNAYENEDANLSVQLQLVWKIYSW